MKRHLRHWLDTLECMLVVAILLAIAIWTWSNFMIAYAPVFKLWKEVYG